MARFVTGKELEDVIYDIIFSAKDQLVLMSPYIKLDQYFPKLLEKHKGNPQLHILIVFGKNERDVSRSVSKEDISYFCQFPNVTIVYVPNLHAKYYGNETKGVITSINLYDFSFKNNIEFGVYTEHSELMNTLSSAINKKTLDDEAYFGAMRVAKEHDVIFAKRPVFKQKALSKFLGGLLGGKDYMTSQVLCDNVEALLMGRTYEKRRLADFKFELDFQQDITSTARPTRAEVEAASPNPTPQKFNERRVETKNAKPEMGYCIRTGEPIPFNLERPLSYQAYRVWAEYGDYDYPERYCHKTGKFSRGRTSMRNPVLYR
ncbi:hypothetical protein [Hymenobacter sp. B81]|uniref:hypothetical protein n=1 Tax=Hymenobacter sp. B81 TaxID=3344878 RepID=UPI0037DD9B04